MSHLGHRLSALIDGELDAMERDRVLVHLAGCESCREDAVALRTLKRRMNALGEAAADAALTRRLIGLAQPSGPAAQGGQLRWPRSAAAGPFASAQRGREVRPSWYVAFGATAVVLVGVGTAAFLAGGGSRAQPVPKVTPAVDTYVLQHDLMNGIVPANSTRSVSHPRKSLSSQVP
jgi:anti-sigma factor RsiW